MPHDRGATACRVTVHVESRLVDFPRGRGVIFQHLLGATASRATITKEKKAWSRNSA